MGLCQQVREITADQLSVPRETITESPALTGDPPADSLDRVEVVVELEDRLGVEIPEEDVENLKTVGDLAQHLERALAERDGE